MVLLLFVAGCKGAPEAPPAECGLSDDSPPITVVVVDEDGARVAADRVRWLDPLTTSGLWEDAAEATCADGEPPCDTWEIAGELPARVLVAADRRDVSLDSEDPPCIGWAAVAVTVEPRDDEPQLVHVTLPTDALWCDDGSTVGPENVGRFEDIDGSDCMVIPAIDAGPLTVRVLEPDGSHSTAARVQWYWPPESEAYDGDHDLVCADPGCSGWISADAPGTGDFYVAAFAYGPPVPDYLAGVFWSGYAAGPQVGTGDLWVELTMEWSLAAF